MAVFVQGGGTDKSKFASGEHWLEHVRCVHGTSAATNTNERVQFVDEGYDLSLGSGDFRKNCLEALLEFSLEFSTGQHGSQI